MNYSEMMSDHLKALKQDYLFTDDFFCQYLNIDGNQLEVILNGEADFLPEDHEMMYEIFNKIGYLYYSATESPDLKLTAFLDVLVTREGISEETIARIAGVDVADVEEILHKPYNMVSGEVKYKIAATVMPMRYFLADLEKYKT